MPKGLGAQKGPPEASSPWPSLRFGTGRTGPGPAGWASARAADTLRPPRLRRHATAHWPAPTTTPRLSGPRPARPGRRPAQEASRCHRPAPDPCPAEALEADPSPQAAPGWARHPVSDGARGQAVLGGKLLSSVTDIPIAGWSDLPFTHQPRFARRGKSPTGTTTKQEKKTVTIVPAFRLSGDKKHVLQQHSVRRPEGLSRPGGRASAAHLWLVQGAPPFSPPPQHRPWRSWITPVRLQSSAPTYAQFHTPPLSLPCCHSHFLTNKDSP